MNLQTILNISVIIFTVANLGAMGLDLEVRQGIKALKNPRLVLLTLGWGWIVGPAIAWLIITFIPMEPAHADGLLLISLAPSAPFLPMTVKVARGDMSFAGSFVLLATIGTVVLMPLMAPFLIKGVAINAWALAKPVLILVLFPLVIGALIKVYASPLAGKIVSTVRKIGTIALVLGLVVVGILYGAEMVQTVGSFATGAQLLLLLPITLLSYKVGLGLKQNQRSAISLGMGTRNIAAVFVAFFGIENAPPEMFTMVVLVCPVTIVIAFIAARIYGKQATVNSLENEA